MTHFFRNNENVVTAQGVLARINGLIETTEKAFNLNGNQHNLDAKTSLMQCRDKVAATARAPVVSPNLSESVSETLGRSTPGFGS